MSKELQILCDTSWLTVEARLYYDDDIVATIPCAEQSNLWYIWDMPTTLPMYEYWVGFYSNNELIGFDLIMWNGVQELWFWNITTWGDGSVIDLTKKHEEILEKYEKMLLEKLQKAMESLPKTDFSSLLAAINNIKPTDLSWLTWSLTSISLQIKNFGDSMRKHHEEEKMKIEEKYKDEIDKKTSLLAENEYNLKEKEKLITELSQKVIDLTEDLEEMQEEKEEELKMMEETYENTIAQSERLAKESLKEKVLQFIES